MGELKRLRSSDFRRVHRLVGEVVERGSDAKMWVEHLLNGLRALTGARVATAGMMPLPAPGQAPSTHSIEARFHSGIDDKRFRDWIDWMDDHDVPEWRALASVPARFYTVRRRDRVDDATWYRSTIYNELFRTLDLDDNMMSNFIALSLGKLMGIGVHRAEGDPPFTERDRRKLKLCHLEIARAYTSSLAVPAESQVAPLSPRQRQVLWRLCKGESEKQVALALALSQHTVHDYVKSLHRHFNVATRSELIAKVLTQPRHRGPLAMPEPHIIRRPS